MPKVKPLGESARRAQRYREDDECIRRQVARLRGEAKLTRGQLARMLGWSEPTLKLRTEDHPEKMTLSHLRQLEALCEAEGVPFCVVIGRPV